MREDYLRTAFNMFDKNGNGKIENDEINALLAGDDLSNFVCKEAIT